MKKILTSLLSIASAVSFSFAADGPKIGEAAPAFSLSTASGETVTLEGLKGKDVVLEWINFDCPFVKKHYTEGNMQKLQADYTEKGAVWILISSANEEHATFKSPADLEKAAKEHKSSATFALVDADGTVGKAYNATTTPNMYIIDQEGVLVYAGAIDDKKSTDAADIAKSKNYVTAALDAVMAGEKVEVSETKPYGCGVKY